MAPEAWKASVPPGKEPEDAYRDADPASFSELPPAELEWTGVRDRAGFEYRAPDGQAFIEIKEGKGGAAQQAVARMLKGIVNVADIVAVRSDDGTVRHLSKEMPLERIREETSDDEVLADVALLAALFKDTDHKPQADHNIAREGGKVSYFDFDFAARDFFETYTDEGEIAHALSGLPPPALYLADAKSAEVEERFSGEEGKAFLARILAASGKEPFDLFGIAHMEDPGAVQDQAALFQEILLRRAAMTRAAIEAKLMEHEQKKAA